MTLPITAKGPSITTKGRVGFDIISTIIIIVSINISSIIISTIIIISISIIISIASAAGGRATSGNEI